MGDSAVLKDYLHLEVAHWIATKTKEFLIDYINIKYCAKIMSVQNLSDYSYLITPAFKSLEGTLIQIGAELKLPINKTQNIGAVFNEERLEKYYNDVLDKIAHLSEENKVDIKQWLSNARRILKSLRHTPAHYLGENKDSITKAFLSGDLIISTIDEMCYTMIQNRLFPSIIKKEQEVIERQRNKINQLRSLP